LFEPAPEFRAFFEQVHFEFSIGPAQLTIINSQFLSYSIGAGRS
jgi:hypothetical protein